MRELPGSYQEDNEGEGKHMVGGKAHLHTEVLPVD
jgi:hypothetical protein